MGDADLELSDGLVCYCFKVTGPTLRALADRHGVTRYEDFAPYSQAGQGCRGCRFEIEAWLAMRRRRATPPDDAGSRIVAERDPSGDACEGLPITPRD